MKFIKKIVVWALTIESRLILRRYKPFVIAVTGSVGKTSTKDAIYDVLKGDGVCQGQNICFVRKSDKSMNSEVGLPLTVIGVPNAWRDFGGWLRNIAAGARLAFKRSEYPDCLVLEVGADHPGDIRRVARWLRPGIAVITRVSRTPVHVEFFKSPEEVFEEKASLADAIRPGGTLVVFADDDKVAALADRVKPRGVSAISFGLNETAAVRAVDIKVLYDEPAVKEWHVESPSMSSTNEFHFAPKTTSVAIGMSFTLVMDDERHEVSVKGIIGNAYLYPLLAAAAVGKARGIKPAEIARSLASYVAPPGRMRLIPGQNGSTLIDDTYNSSPDAASAALSSLKSIECAGTRFAVLGDMLELGKYATEEHRRIGKEAAVALLPADRLITVGQRSRLSAEEAVAAGLSADYVQSFDSATEAATYLEPLVRTGDIVLIKGSQSIRMERVTATLMRDPEKASDILVRQEREWLDKK